MACEHTFADRESLSFDRRPTPAIASTLWLCSVMTAVCAARCQRLRRRDRAPPTLGGWRPSVASGTRPRSRRLACSAVSLRHGRRLSPVRRREWSALTRCAIALRKQTDCQPKARIPQRCRQSSTLSATRQTSCAASCATRPRMTDHGAEGVGGARHVVGAGHHPLHGVVHIGLYLSRPDMISARSRERARQGERSYRGRPSK